MHDLIFDDTTPLARQPFFEQNFDVSRMHACVE